MAKIKKKKTRLRVGPVLIVIILLSFLGCGIYYLLGMKIENIIILGNEHVSDEKIIEEAGLTDYPSFYWTSSGSIKRKVLADPLIEKVTVKKKFFHVIEITVQEYKMLYKQASDNKVVLSDGSILMTDENIPYLPVLLNYVPDTKQEAFHEGMNNIKDDIRNQISEITYDPNDYDKDRFLLLMDDGNSVYLTLTKFDMINYYDEVLPQLEVKKGILYLDSGNHFQIMES